MRKVGLVALTDANKIVKITWTEESFPGFWGLNPEPFFI